MNIKVKKLREQAILPHRATSDSAGADLCACLTEPVTIEPNHTVMIGTGLAIEVPSGYAAFVSVSYTHLKECPREVILQIFLQWDMIQKYITQDVLR